MTYLSFFDCSGCKTISYYDCCTEPNSINIVKKNGYVYYNIKSYPPLSCCSGCPIDTIKLATQQKIQNTVRVSTGLYLDNLASLTVRGSADNNTPSNQTNFVNKSQASDRVELSIQKQIANPRLRPGKLGPGGVGVDVKHNSFDRILARKKAQNMRTESSMVSTPLSGNRVKKYGITNQTDCICKSSFGLSFY